MAIAKKLKRGSIKFRPSLFWDIDVSKLDPDKNPEYVIERILDFGDDKEVRWMTKYFPRDRIKSVVQTSRVLLPKSRSFWSLYYR